MDNRKSQFEKFAGREVNVAVETMDIIVLEKKLSFPTYKLADPQEPSLASLREAAQDAGFKLVVLLPDQNRTMQQDPNRVVAKIEKHEDGKFRIGACKIG